MTIRILSGSALSSSQRRCSYTYVGQMVPQKEVLPPQRTLIRADLTTDDMVKVGQEIMNGKGLCFTCHTLGKTEGRPVPDMSGVDVRAKTRVPGLSDGPSTSPNRYTNPRSSSCRDSIRGMPSSTSLRSASTIRKSSA